MLTKFELDLSQKIRSHTIGALKSATLDIAGKAATAHQRGLISLAELNRGLMGSKKYCTNISWKEKKCE